jgi:glycosyltransferase involved in cell wall biosynthesis
VSASRRAPCVVVAHAGRQHSHHAAAALAGAGLLAAYWSGLGPGSDPAFAQLSERTIGFAWAPALRRILERTLPGRASGWGDHLANRLFDRRAAVRLRDLRPRLVIGYEMACAELFAIARTLGTRTMLDAASLHHATQDEWRRPLESPRLHRRIRAVKDRELALADHVVVASELAARSYLGGGFSPGRISVVPLGVDRERFRPGPGGAGGLALLFVGKLSETKGVDLLLSAWTDVSRERPGARLRLAGQGGWRAALPPGAELRRPVRDELIELYQQADLLVLPSRLDGFGLVVAEALACGTPVVVSDHVGAKDLVVEGVNGWVVPAGSVEALAARLAWCADHVEQVRALRPACVESVRDAGWDAYARRLVAVVEGILAERPR